MNRTFEQLHDRAAALSTRLAVVYAIEGDVDQAIVLLIDAFIDVREQAQQETLDAVEHNFRKREHDERA